MSQDCSDVFDIYAGKSNKIEKPRKQGRRGISFRILKQTTWENLLKITAYKIYPADYDAALAELRAAEARGEVTDIETEE